MSIKRLHIVIKHYFFNMVGRKTRNKQSSAEPTPTSVVKCEIEQEGAERGDGGQRLRKKRGNSSTNGTAKAENLKSIKKESISRKRISKVEMEEEKDDFEDSRKVEKVQTKRNTRGRQKRAKSVSIDSKRGASKKRKIEKKVNESENLNTTKETKSIKKSATDDIQFSHKNNRNQCGKKRNLNIHEKTQNEDLSEEKKVKENNKEIIKLSDESEESDDDDWEEVEELQGVIESPMKMTLLIADNKTIEITVDGPNQTKKKKKEEMWEDYFRREMNRYNKEQQVAIHKAHLLSLLALGQYRSRVCSSNTLQGFSLSIIPEKFAKWEELPDIAYLVRFVRWFQSQFQVNSEEKETSRKDFDEVLCSRFEKFEVANEIELIHIFASLLHCLHLCVRLICSLQPVSFKPKNIIKKPSSKSPTDSGTSTSRKSNQESKSNVDPFSKDNDLNKKEIPASKRKMRTKNKSKRASASKVSNKRKVSENDDELSNDDNSGSDEDWTMVQKRTQKKKHVSSSTSMDSDSDFEQEVMNISKSKKSSRKKKPKASEGVEEKICSGRDVWVEVFLETENKWVTIDCISGAINHPEKCESYATRPVCYVMSFSQDGSIKDLTKKYASNWMTQTRKLRIDHTDSKWWTATLKPFKSKDDELEETEDQQLQANLLNRPMPTSVSGFKNHPLYALKRHLLKFEAIYPESASILGYCRGEPIYSRDCVHELHAKEAWIKQARIVRIGEEPYKFVKARPKPHQIKNGEPPLPLALYGFWQTEEYMAPPAVDGKVPRNEHGNVELYKPSMLPVGTVHLQIPGLNKVARKLDIDCAPAMVGWDFHCGYSHPVFDGFIVCEEFKDTLVEAWGQEQLEIDQKRIEKREARVLKNWRLLTKGLLIRERLNKRFQSSNNPDSAANENEEAIDCTTAWPLNRNMQHAKDKVHLFPFEKI